MNAYHDSAIHELIRKEWERQQWTINLIASENYANHEILEATGSCLTNKYAEGYPGKRYYAGCAVVDNIEELAIERCKKLFGAKHANVQPHAGSQANFAVYAALLKPGDTIMGMRLADGGHLTHGHEVNLSGVIYNTVAYGVDPHTHLIDYDHVEELARKHKPRLIIAGASAYPRIIDFARMSAIAHNVNAYAMADIAHIAGLVATGLHPNPVPYMDVVTSTTHKTLRGPRGGLILCTEELAPLIDKAVMPGTQGGPFMHLIAAKAVAFAQAMTPTFVLYQQQVLRNARVMADECIQRDYALVTAGTENHLIIIDLNNKGITGRKAEQLLENIGITVSRSMVPHDKQKPWITSGIRIGTPAITTRGFGAEEAAYVVRIIDNVLTRPDDQKTQMNARQEVKQLCSALPLTK